VWVDVHHRVCNGRSRSFKVFHFGSTRTPVCNFKGSMPTSVISCPVSDLLKVFCWIQLPNPYSTHNFGDFRLGLDCGSEALTSYKLLIGLRVITLEVKKTYFNFTNRQTDRQTDRGTDSISKVLCSRCIARRAVKVRNKEATSDIRLGHEKCTGSDRREPSGSAVIVWALGLRDTSAIYRPTGNYLTVVFLGHSVYMVIITNVTGGFSHNGSLDDECASCDKCYIHNYIHTTRINKIYEAQHSQACDNDTWSKDKKNN